MTQLAVIGKTHAHMLEAKSMGLSSIVTPQGKASEWLRDGIFAKLGKALPGEPEEA